MNWKLFLALHLGRVLEYGVMILSDSENKPLLYIPNKILDVSHTQCVSSRLCQQKQDLEGPGNSYLNLWKEVVKEIAFPVAGFFKMKSRIIYSKNRKKNSLTWQIESDCFYYLPISLTLSRRKKKGNMRADKNEIKNVISLITWLFFFLQNNKSSFNSSLPKRFDTLSLVNILPTLSKKRS